MSEISSSHGKDSTTSVSLSTCGATLTSWKVKGEEMIFVSSIAKRDGSKAIRGGIPLCFPVFGPWDNGKPQHGLARNSNDWIVKEQTVDDNGDANIVMSLSTNENTKKLWEHEFEFTYSVKLTTDQLFLKASVDNKGEKDFELTFCFHTYFRVPKIAGASVRGLSGLTYVDKTQGGKLVKEENETIHVDSFVDRVYQNAPDNVEVMIDANRKITLTKENLRDYVVWNPWQENCEKMGDMDNDGYLSMLCVEAAQASEKSIVKAGTTWTASHFFTLS